MIPETVTAFDQGKNKKILLFSGKSGGEGAIYNIEGDARNCAKIFFKSKISPELHEKILTMVRYPPGGNLTKPGKEITSSSIAWPSSALYIFNRGRSEFIGYIMPRIDTEMFREAHMYYDTDDRLKMLGGNFSWQYLMTAAYNISYVVSKIHEIGHCIGDFSPRNVLIARTAAVSFIDCDSFQICNPEKSRTFYTKVGTGDFLPPELLGRNFRKEDLNRYYSDLFALGIIVFRLLMNGAHPYQAAGRKVWDLPTIEQKIIKGIYPYSHNRMDDIRPPGYAPPYRIIPSCLKDLFRRCFVDGHKEPLLRPAAEEWCRCLLAEMKSLKCCNINRNHWYSGELYECPWCSASSNGTRDIFPCSSNLKDSGNRMADRSQSRSRVPARIKRSDLSCRPEKFSFRRESEEPFREKIEITDNGLDPGTIKIESDSIWIGDITPPYKSDDKIFFEFTVSPKRIPSRRNGIKYAGNILIKAGSETKKIPVEIGSAVNPVLEIKDKKIIIRGFDSNTSNYYSFSVNNAGKGWLRGTAESDCDWLKIIPDSFSTQSGQEFQIILQPEKMKMPLIKCNITIRTNGGDRTIPLYASIK